MAAADVLSFYRLVIPPDVARTSRDAGDGMLWMVDVIAALRTNFPDEQVRA